MGGCAATFNSAGCDDGDACLPESGCANVPAAGGCTDGNPCTVNDARQDGQCIPGQLLDCDGAYGGQFFLAGKVTLSAGIQLWTVPFTGTYRIEAYGAKGGFALVNGGNGGDSTGGFGAGGYSGGGGGGNNCNGAGGGAGSYNSGANASNSAGANSGHGKVRFLRL